MPRSKIISDYRFGTYILPLQLADKRRIERHFIVIKNKGGRIVCFTDFQKYCYNPDRKLKSITENGGNMAIYVCLFLNYAFYTKYHVKKLTDITANMFSQFMNDYGTGKLPEDIVAANQSAEITSKHIGRSRTSVERCSSAVLSFLRNVASKNPSSAINVRDLYEKKSYRTTKGNIAQKIRPNFVMVYDPEVKVTFRDIPEKVFYIFLNEIIENHKDILMLAALGAFAGLRPSEACNVRRTDSSLGSGLIFDRVYLPDDASDHFKPRNDAAEKIVNRLYQKNESASGKLRDVRIDLTKELTLRSDMSAVGGIKKERWQHVYEPFLELFDQCYGIYMTYLEGQLYEADYGPLTLSRNHMAMTYDTYRNHFKKMVSSIIPTMLLDDDPEVVEYAHMLQEHEIAPHIFRHWFTVQLVLFGEDVGSIQYWRGDKSPESALSYINSKSDLMRRYKKVNDEQTDFMLWKAKKLHGSEKN